ncbi:MAG: hypothetical protein U0572_03150 [Phycisphaerales bacterium]
MGFHLLKRYVDVVDAAGSVAIGYWARLRWGPLRLGFASVDIDADGVRTGTSALGSSPPPIRSGSSVTWNSPRLGLRGAWSEAAAGTDRTLFARGDRAVRWECWAPRASATLVVGDRTLVGSGYVEEIELTIEPWRLPIDELRWGRFATRERSVVWIEWKGPRPLRLVLVDGAERSGSEIHGDAIRWSGGQLRLAEQRTLRDAPLAGGALAAVPKLLRSAPASILAAHETKWLARASLIEDATSASADGFALHEVVRFARGDDGDRG